jgi:hypothetical protein
MATRIQLRSGRPGPEANANRLDPLNSERVALERRLDDGYRRIESARLDGLDVGAWEEFWIQLLREYESISDEVQRLAA